MGTRNLTAVKISGEYKIAQYGQWDGYPGGQGATAVEFLRGKGNRERLKRALKHCVWVTQGELDAKTKELGIGEWMTPEEAARYHAAFPFMSRDHGAEILRMVATAPKEARPIKLRNSLEFAADSLFCEWAYVVDFDTNTFEVYKGFNQSPLKKSERFYGVTTNDVAEKYQPIRLVKSYRLGRLPKPDAFVKALNKMVGEEEG
jgi:hypothetical protein